MNGNLTSRKDDANGNINFTFDALNRLVKETPPPPQGVNTYQYDATGNITLVADQGGDTAYTYDSVNMVTSVTDPAGAKTTFSYDDPRDTFRTKTVYPNGVTMSVTPDGSTRIKEIKATNAANQILTKFTYSYADASGDTMLRQSVTDKFGVKTTYTYDPVNRLKTADVSNTTGTDYSYGYDPNSNLISKAIPGTTTNLSYNGANELTQAGSVTYNYDGAGNLISSSAGFAASYNAKNQTTSMTPPGGQPVPMTYQDASQTKRISASLTDFDYTVLGLSTQTDKGPPDKNSFINPDNVKQLALEKVDETVQEVTQERSELIQSQAGTPPNQAETPSVQPDASGVQTDTSATQTTSTQSSNDATSQLKKSTFFTRDNLGTLMSERRAEGTYYYLFDGLGSVIGLTDGSGAVVADYKYDPYGKQTSAEPAVDNPWRFASGYTDPPTGFVKFGTRYYDPTVMRWTQLDPKRGSIRNPITLNPFQYAGENPINSSDLPGTAYCDINFQFMVWNIGWYCYKGWHFYSGPAGGVPGFSVMGGPGKPSCQTASVSGGYWLGGAGGVNDKGVPFWEAGFVTPGFAASSAHAESLC